MKGFALTASGDVAISNNKIVMVDGEELVLQTLKSVLGTNKGEWPLNPDEGIRFQNILGKNKTEDMVKYEVQEGIAQVDGNIEMTSFEFENIENRSYKAKVGLSLGTGEETSINLAYGNISSSLPSDNKEDSYIPAVPFEPSNKDAGFSASEINSMIDSATKNMYQYKGSVATYENLPFINVRTGDVYNVEQDGMNYAWNGSKWDSLGSALSDVITNQEIDQIMNSI